MRRVRFRPLGMLLLLLSSGLLAFNHPQPVAAAWQPKTPPISTPWTYKVDPAAVLPEYPRPQLTRSDWLNLNGEWQLLPGNPSLPSRMRLPQTILVPFPVESALSGVMQHYDWMTYYRSFTLPAAWDGQRVQLNFGAVDWQATVYVNNVLVGSHQGGYDAFTFDITDQLVAGSNVLRVVVYDPTNQGGQPIGKQRINPGGIWYTPASGIWQTVWLEPTSAAHITRLDMNPDVPGERLRITIHAAGVTSETVQVTARSNGAVVGTVSGPANAELSLPVPNAHLWWPHDPFLYDLEVTLLDGATPVDQVGSYFGMRSVGMKLVGGVLRPVINGEFIFQMGTLDQGYWPDGIYTAPTDDALRFDIEQHKNLGYTMIRKHIKVEPQRWFYWADRLGLLVWQDMPLMDTRTPSLEARAQFELELRELIDEHRSATSVVMWVVQNEGWGQYDQARLADLVKSWDPDRLVDNMSGINCCGAVDGGNGDVADWHVYVGPGAPVPTATRASVLGEFGGYGLRFPGHTWSAGPYFSYQELASSAELTTRYVELMQRTQELMQNPGLSAAVYTEITDVENEINGMFTYDRQILKVDLNQVQQAHISLLNAGVALNDLGLLPLDQYRSLQVATPGFTDRFVSVDTDLGITEVVTNASAPTDKFAATFKLVPGLADSACYSFQSRLDSTHYLRHYDFRVHSDAADSSPTFTADATFCATEPLYAGGQFSLEAKNMPGFFMRHRDSEVWMDAFEDTAQFRQDASFDLAQPWWRSSADLASDEYHSLQVTTPGFTDRFVRHANSLAHTAVVDAGSSALLKADATFKLVPGLADNSCYSFEARNFPGEFLRHSGYRLRLAVNDNSTTLKNDATFCARPGLSGTGISFESYNYVGYFIRHRNAEVWIDPYENSSLFKNDASWAIAAPWTP